MRATYINASHFSLLEMGRTTEKGSGKGRICFVLESGHLAYSRDVERMGGQEVQFKVVPEKLALLGYEVFMLCDRPLPHKGITFLKADRLYSIFRRIRPDVVVTTIATKTALKAALACRLLGIDFVYWLPHDEESELKIGRGRKGSAVGRLLFVAMLRRFTKKIIVQNETQKRNMEGRGFGPKLVLFRNAHPFTREKIEPARKKSVLWVSRFLDWKRPELFVEMARRMKKREFVMIAPGVSPEFKESCRDVGNLRIVDFVPYAEIAAYYKGARIYVCTSRFEGFPNAFQDAAAEGTPIVSLDVDPDCLFRRYGHGFLVRDVEGACRTIETLFTDRMAYLKACESAYRYMAEVHDVNATVGSLLEQILPED